MAVEISDWDELQTIDLDLTGDYVLVNDLDENTDGYPGDGFEPIGFVENSSFTSEFVGTLNGDGYSIRDLVVDKTDVGDIGLIASMDTGGLVENLSVGGKVTNSDVDGECTGGLVGYMRNGVVQNCSSDVDVVASGDRVGVLVGHTRNDSEVWRTYTYGSVEGRFSVGGSVGDHRGTLIDSYSLSSVEGEYDVGGLAGLEDDYIENCYAAGPVTGEGDDGGLTGRGWGDVIDSYWDTEATGYDTSDKGTGLTTAEMQGSEAETNMEGFDFADVWDSVLESDGDTTADGYPILTSVDRENQLEAQGILSLLEPPQAPTNLVATLG